MGSALPHISSAPVGTTFTFSLNEVADVALTFNRVLPGRRETGSCVAPSKTNRGRPRCNRSVIVGSLALPGHAGTDTIRFQGRLSRSRQLTPGNYTVSVTSHDSHGLKTLTRSLSFTILP
jgi:hypothetical protein